MQLSNDTEPFFSVVMPSGQYSHSRMLSLSRYCPMGHSIHFSPPAKYLPRGHGSEKHNKLQCSEINKI